jgi:hypothetical protein
LKAAIETELKTRFDQAQQRWVLVTDLQLIEKLVLAMAAGHAVKATLTLERVHG